MMDLNLQVNQKENSFLSEVNQASGETIQACFQCQKCSAGCVPSLMRWISSPIKCSVISSTPIVKRFLRQKTIWICASCYTCSVRCPNNIRYRQDHGYPAAALPPSLRGRTGRKGYSLFHSVFLDTSNRKADP